MRAIVFSILFLMFLQGLCAQNYSMYNGSVSTCEGRFYDSGGKTGNYSANEDYVFTISSAIPESMVVMKFTFFRLSGNDWLAVYDGKDIKSTIIGTYSGKNPLKGEIRSTSGSLTFSFHSNGQSSEVGWEAIINCIGNNPEIIQNNSIINAPFVLTYSVKGLKSEADFEILKSLLEKHDYVINSTFNFQKETLLVSATDSIHLDEIKQLLLSSQKALGYEISVDFIKSSR